MGTASTRHQWSAVAPTLTVSVGNVSAYQGAPNVQITASVRSSDGTVVKQGQVLFKIVSPTTRLHLGQHLTAPVTNGVATLSLSLPSNQKTGSYNITAYYVPNANQSVGPLSPTGTGTLNVLSQV